MMGATGPSVSAAAAAAIVQTPACARDIKADVVAFDQVITYNRFGAFNPAGMMYALRRDVVPINSSQGLVAGNVQFRLGKRPRPLVLRANEGDCLTVTFTNLLTDDREEIDDINFTNQPNKQPYRNEPIRLRPDGSPFTRHASMHVNGPEYVDAIGSDGSNVGNNGSTLAASGETKVYKWYARKQGMWELWRVHDVFEAGTADRNLPDGEIAGGAPNPAVVPLPTKAMPPMPSATFKGYPFYIAAQTGTFRFFIIVEALP